VNTASVRRTVLVGAAAVGLIAGLAACAGPAAESVPSADSAPVTIYLTRHGETMLNVLSRAQGWADSPLTKEGQDIAVDLGEGLAEGGVTFDAAYSADMVRQYTTATLALKGADQHLTPVRDERLREIDFGGFEGASNDEMWTAAAKRLGYPNEGAMFGDMGKIGMDAALDAIAASNPEPSLPAETSDEVRTRAMAALDEIGAEAQKKGEKNVLVVSSGITIYVALEGMGADLSKVATGIDNAAVSKLVYDDGDWTVKSVNDLSYVEAGQKD